MYSVQSDIEWSRQHWDQKVHGAGLKKFCVWIGDEDIGVHWLDNEADTEAFIASELLCDEHVYRCYDVENVCMRGWKIQVKLD